MTYQQIQWKSYHRAQRLGDGACGAVNMCYDDDGKVFAMKSFKPDEDDGTLALETLRELAMLRLMQGPNQHPNIVGLTDLCEVEDELCMVMPKFTCDLKGAIAGKALNQKGLKLRTAHGILSAVAHLHDNNVIHRDIKTENVMFTEDMSPVLIDFGLAKIISGYGRYGATHTSDCGTAGYMAPEVYAKEPYGIAADIWSVGIILLEMFTGELKCDRDKAAFQKVRELKAQLPNKPIPNLITRLLEEDPTKRVTAREALRLPIFANPKLGLIQREPRFFTTRRSRIVSENTKNGKRKKKTILVCPLMCRKVCSTFGVENAFVPIAAWTYFNATYGDPCKNHEDTELLKWVNCVLMAIKVYEEEKIDIEECEEEFPEVCGSFDIDDYVEEEKRILKAMQYCVLVPSF